MFKIATALALVLYLGCHQAQANDDEPAKGDMSQEEEAFENYKDCLREGSFSEPFCRRAHPGCCGD